MQKLEDKEPLLSLAQRQLVALLRLSIDGQLDHCLDVCKIDWEKVYAEAERQGGGITFAGIEWFGKLYDTITI